MINETNSKVEQGNDNLIACDGNGNSTATENYSTMSVIIPWFFSRSYRGTWNVCLVSTLDPSFMVAGRWLRGGRTAWYGSGIVGMMYRSCGVTRLHFARPVITFSLFVSWIVPLWPATTFCSYFLFLQVLFRCICILSYGCVGLSVRR